MILRNEFNETLKAAISFHLRLDLVMSKNEAEKNERISNFFNRIKVFWIYDEQRTIRLAEINSPASSPHEFRWPYEV